MFQPFTFARQQQQLPAGYPGYYQSAVAPAGFVQLATPWVSPAGQVVAPTTTIAALTPTMQAIILLSTAFSAWHGYKRNRESIPFGALWGFAGAVLPVLTPAVAVIQGYAKPERK